MVGKKIKEEDYFPHMKNSMKFNLSVFFFFFFFGFCFFFFCKLN